MHSKKHSLSTLRLSLLAFGKTTFSFPARFLKNGLLHRDTVNSVGLIPRRLPFTASNTIIRTFRHAVSLDERRAKFKANLWNQPPPAEPTLDGQKPGVKLPKAPKVKSNGKAPKLKVMERQYSMASDEPTDIEEVSTFFVLLCPYLTLCA